MYVLIFWQVTVTSLEFTSNQNLVLVFKSFSKCTDFFVLFYEDTSSKGICYIFLASNYTIFLNYLGKNREDFVLFYSGKNESAVKNFNRYF